MIRNRGDQSPRENNEQVSGVDVPPTPQVKVTLWDWKFSRLLDLRMVNSGVQF